MPQTLDHLLIGSGTTSADFKSSLRAFPPKPPVRDRKSHGRRLLEQLARLDMEGAELLRRRIERGLDQDRGMTIALKVRPKGAVDFTALEWKRAGIEVLSVADSGGAQIAALFVPDGSLSAFASRVTQYLNEDTKVNKPGSAAKPMHARLIESIEDFRRAAFSELWTEDKAAPPGEEPEWVQVWLRNGRQDSPAVYATFMESAGKLNLPVGAGFVSFPGRTVVSVHASRPALESALDLLDQIAEIRAIRPSAEFYLSDLRPLEQAEWLHNLTERTTLPAATAAPFVTLLDTGVNRGHPLLSSLLAPQDMHTVVPEWGVTDERGHGTEMAGLMAHGDLTAPLTNQEAHVIPHRLESVKILPPTGQNPQYLYGWVTAKAANTVEAASPHRRRTFAMMTTAVGTTTGLPSDWSAMVDQLAFGLSPTAPYIQAPALPPHAQNPLQPRVFVVAAGNVPWHLWSNYPNENLVATIEDPGQAWNALTVGAYTDLTEIDAVKWPSLNPISPAGALAPCSTTSLLWSPRWPIKPDVVAEGGNGAIDMKRGNSPTVGPESLRLLACAGDFPDAPFSISGDTSAAAAQVARICGHLQARYPNYWPETVRALVVHGARHTKAMRAELPNKPLKADIRTLVRKYGYGKVDLTQTLDSTAHRATLVLQREIQPYARIDGDVKLNVLHLHDLPWPQEQLQQLGHQQVELRVTLSYFVEPNPSRRGWQSKFRYQSHGLRFAVQGSTETTEQFLRRVNELQREDVRADPATDDLDAQEAGAPNTGKTEVYSDYDSKEWLLGSKLRARGSLHSDVWTGTAARVASKSKVAVFPVGGWWKDWVELQRHAASVRYALAITLEVSEDVDVDLYTPISNAIAVTIAAQGS